MIIAKFVYVRDFFVYDCKGVGTCKVDLHPFLPFSAVSSPRTVMLCWVNSLGVLCWCHSPGAMCHCQHWRKVSSHSPGAAVVAAISSGHGAPGSAGCKPWWNALHVGCSSSPTAWEALWVLQKILSLVLFKMSAGQSCCSLLRLGMGVQTALSAQKKGGTAHSEPNTDSNNRDFY